MFLLHLYSSAVEIMILNIALVLLYHTTVFENQPFAFSENPPLVLMLGLIVAK